MIGHLHHLDQHQQLRQQQRRRRRRRRHHRQQHRRRNLVVSSQPHKLRITKDLQMLLLHSCRGRNDPGTSCRTEK